jgi:hypothetical protein
VISTGAYVACRQTPEIGFYFNLLEQLQEKPPHFREYFLSLIAVSNSERESN